jgi:hypothetical protein
MFQSLNVQGSELKGGFVVSAIEVVDEILVPFIWTYAAFTRAERRLRYSSRHSSIMRLVVKRSRARV